MALINAFNDVERNDIQSSENVAGLDDLRTIAALEVGHGARSFKGDSSGIWMGANKFADAPFKVNMDGQLVATGPDGIIEIDNINNRILIYDDNGIPIILIGYHLNGF